MLLRIIAFVFGAILFSILVMFDSDFVATNRTCIFLLDRFSNVVVADGTIMHAISVVILTILLLVDFVPRTARCCGVGRPRAAKAIAAEEHACMGTPVAKRDPTSGAWPAAAPSILEKPVLGEGAPLLEMRAVALFKRRCDLLDDLTTTSAEATKVKAEKGHVTLARMRVPATSVVRVLRDGFEGSVEYHRTRRSEAYLTHTVSGMKWAQRAVLAQCAGNVAQLEKEFARRTGKSRPRAPLTAETMAPGMFGENIYFEGPFFISFVCSILLLLIYLLFAILWLRGPLLEGERGVEISSATLCVGDLFRVRPYAKGSAAENASVRALRRSAPDRTLVLQVSSPRRPCSAIDARHGNTFSIHGSRAHCAKTGACCATALRRRVPRFRATADGRTRWTDARSIASAALASASHALTPLPSPPPPSLSRSYPRYSQGEPVFFSKSCGTARCAKAICSSSCRGRTRSGLCSASRSASTAATAR
jgi:hypothetical protein